MTHRLRPPSISLMLAHPAHLLALGFGTGLSPIAPGTFGTLAAVPLYFLLAEWMDPAWILALCVILFLVGIWACDRTGHALGVADHGAINWDEIVAFLAVLVFVPPGWAWQLGAFAVFRAFDIAKPPPIRYFERTIKGGYGVMFDDLIAAFYTLLVLAVARQWLG